MNEIVRYHAALCRRVTLALCYPHTSFAPYLIMPYVVMAGCADASAVRTRAMRGCALASAHVAERRRGQSGAAVRTASAHVADASAQRRM